MPATPLSVEDILAKQKAEKEAAAKVRRLEPLTKLADPRAQPKFLTKAQRAALALEKRAQEVTEQKAREQADRAERDKLDRAADAEARRQQEAARYGGRGDERDRRDGPRDYRGGRDGGLDYRDRDDRRRDDRRGDGRDDRRDDRRGDRGRKGGAAPAPAAAGGDPDLEIIKKRYLGQHEVVKKPWMRKAANKNAIFDWSAADDTSSAPLWSAAGSPARPGSGAHTPVPDTSGDKYTDALEKRRAGKGSNDDRHWSEKPLEEMKERDWRIFREDYSISSRGGNIPNPLRSWRESAIPLPILDVIDEIGYKEPSPVQRQAVPIGLQNRDLVGLAKTGSGKTAAFLIPMLTYISRLPPLTEDNRHLGPYALILAPTRELAQQIETEAVRFAGPMGYTTVSIVGGRSVEEQQFNLRNGAQIVIATPGRLKDMIDKSMLVMSQCRYVVMDEADRMVDLGFEIDLTFILDAMPASFAEKEGLPEDDPKRDRVMTLFSATMPPAVERLTRKYLRKPATVIIGNAGEAVDTVEQRVEFVTSEEKRKARLIDILRNIGLPPPIIVFVNQKKTADMVLKYVQQAGLSGVTLHSGKNQEQREASLQALRDGDVSVLVATDLAGRGIDVPDVSLVLNWQMSDTIEKYVHRIGRTGRAGKTGLAITFLDNNDDEVMYDLKQEIAKSPLSTMNPELSRHEAARQKVTREMKRKRDEFDE
ncbi:hypothetical protein VHUM_01844 [Vanrija humicola]|uniref:RNA helicase n=1 Tax=Vanrija humicola TaxID=5417 RepID=A0A7D8V2L5_VANHU|nr:hypothetical protein VHUM_01844 [Vanrija humicola]